MFFFQQKAKCQALRWLSINCLRNTVHCLQFWLQLHECLQTEKYHASWPQTNLENILLSDFTFQWNKNSHSFNQCFHCSQCNKGIWLQDLKSRNHASIICLKVFEVSPFVRRNVSENKININSTVLSRYVFAMAWLKLMANFPLGHMQWEHVR